LRLLGVVAVSLLLANCASNPHKFASSKLGVKASPRVVQIGERAPKGGGRRQTGVPYVVAGKRYEPIANPRGYSKVGVASWYGSAFHGRLTSNGEVYDVDSLSAAHPTLPIPSEVRVTNLQNGRSVVVRVNDRGPYHGGRILDASQKTAELLGFQKRGTTRVRVDYVGPASLAGSDDRALLATYREDGRGATPPRELAASLPRVPLASNGHAPTAERPPARPVVVARAAPPAPAQRPIPTERAPVRMASADPIAGLISRGNAPRAVSDLPPRRTAVAIEARMMNAPQQGRATAAGFSGSGRDLY
jgi:rare lipoprotein A